MEGATDIIDSLPVDDNVTVYIGAVEIVKNAQKEQIPDLMPTQEQLQQQLDKADEQPSLAAIVENLENQNFVDVIDDLETGNEILTSLNSSNKP